MTLIYSMQIFKYESKSNFTMTESIDKDSLSSLNWKINKELCKIFLFVIKKMFYETLFFISNFESEKKSYFADIYNVKFPFYFYRATPLRYFL